MSKAGSGDAQFQAPGDIAPVRDGVLNHAFFKSFQDEYHRKTGYQLVLSDLDGSIQLGLPDCDKFPCMQSCRTCREEIFREAIRTRQVCMDTCHEGYTIWGLPVIVGKRLIGGLVVIGGEHRNDIDLTRFEQACETLYEMMVAYGLFEDATPIEGKPHKGHHRIISKAAFRQVHGKIVQQSRILIDSLKLANYEVADSACIAIRETLSEATDLPLEVLCALIGDLIFEAKRQFIQAGLDAYSCTAEAGELLAGLSELSDPADLTAFFSKVYERIVFLSMERTKDQDELLVERAATYVEENLRVDLSRESVAKAIGVSPSRFSRLIHERKGRTFTDFVNQYRVERAALLLVRTAKSLAQIASETGFCDQSYFSKVFRRYKDKTPAQYRVARKDD